MKSIFDPHTGIIKQAPKQEGKAARKRKQSVVDARNAERNICLSCTLPKCNGCGGKTFERKKKLKEEGKL